ncbi:MAG: hypothetical protein GU356_00225 [Pyrobaculum sp.]|nr:hypothetical protein [Pyrobaculum sp.]
MLTASTFFASLGRELLTEGECVFRDVAKVSRRISRRRHVVSLRARRPSPRAEAGGERRKAYKPSERGRKLLSRLKGCALETGEGFYWRHRLAYAQWSL